MIEYDDERLIRIQRIQRKFQEDLPSEKKLKYLKYLSGVPVSVEILKETSIGKTINLLRKEDGVIGQISKQLVLKWKEIATSEYGSNAASNQQINDKQKNNKNNVAVDSVKHSVNKHSESSSPNQNDSCNHLINGISRAKGEGNSSSSPSKPKIPLEEKPKKLGDVPSKHSKKKHVNKCDFINDESLNNESKSIVPSNELNDEKLDVRKDKKNEKKTKENSPSKNDTNTELQKKKQCRSFEEMLMMPVLPTKKKKKKSEPSNAEIPEPARMPTLPDIELPQINTVPVYRPSRPLPNLRDEEMKKKIIPAPILRFQDITSRKTKSVMYTGKKSNNGVVLSLYQMCMRILIENVDALYETGGVPFSVLEPVLSKCSPAQLERLEYYNPHFIEDTDALWKMHCQHDFKGRRIDDDTVGAWRDMYKELSVEREEKLRRLSTKISASQAAKVPERSAKLAFVTSAPKPSVQILRKQKKHGTGEKAKEKEKEKDVDNGEKQKEIRERMVKEQEESSDVHVPFAKVPRRDRCSKRPPSSLSSNIHNQVPEPKKQKKEEELGSVGPAALMPKPKKKKGKKPMMLMAMKLLKKQKSRMAAPIMRK